MRPVALSTVILCAFLGMTLSAVADRETVDVQIDREYIVPMEVAWDLAKSVDVSAPISTVVILTIREQIVLSGTVLLEEHVMLDVLPKHGVSAELRPVLRDVVDISERPRLEPYLSTVSAIAGTRGAPVFDGPGSTHNIVERRAAGTPLEIAGVDKTGGWHRLTNGSWIASMFVDGAPRLLALGDGARIWHPFPAGVPSAAENDWLIADVKLVRFAYGENCELDMLEWQFALLVKQGVLDQVTVYDVTGDRQEYQVREAAAITHAGQIWSNGKILGQRPTDSLQWIDEPGPTVFIFRFDVVMQDGTELSLYQPVAITEDVKARMTGPHTSDMICLDPWAFLE